MNNDPMPTSASSELPPPPRRLSWWDVPVSRDPQDRKLAGVVAGIAKPLGFDLRTTRFAVAVAALALPGVTALYVAAWILLPKTPEHARSLHDIVTERRRRPLLFALGLLAIFSGFGSWAFFGGVGWGVTLLGVGVVLWLSPNFGSGLRSSRADVVTSANPAAGATAAGWPAPSPASPTAAGAFTTTTAIPTARASTRPARVRRRRHPIQALSLVAAFVTAMVISLGNAAHWWNASVYGTTVTVLAILVAGTVIGAVVNRSWFGIPMLVVLMAIGGALLITHPNLNGGFGDRELQPATLDEAANVRHLGAGRLRIDLTGLPAQAMSADASKTVTVRADVGYGQIRVVVPNGVELHLITRVGAGHVVLDGTELIAGVRHEDDRVVPAVGEQVGSGAKPRTIVLDLEVGGGEISIVRAG
jgi:phage shock protein PspC (stress-responsive transcriptional regulator)